MKNLGDCLAYCPRIFMSPRDDLNFTGCDCKRGVPFRMVATELFYRSIDAYITITLPEALEAQLPTSEHCPCAGGILPVFDLSQIQGPITLSVCGGDSDKESRTEVAAEGRNETGSCERMRRI